MLCTIRHSHYFSIFPKKGCRPFLQSVFLDSENCLQGSDVASMSSGSFFFVKFFYGNTLLVVGLSADIFLKLSVRKTSQSKERKIHAIDPHPATR